MANKTNKYIEKYKNRENNFKLNQFTSKDCFFSLSISRWYFLKFCIDFLGESENKKFFFFHLFKQLFHIQKVYIEKTKFRCICIRISQSMFVYKVWAKQRVNDTIPLYSVITFLLLAFDIEKKWDKLQTFPLWFHSLHCNCENWKRFHYSSIFIFLYFASFFSLHVNLLVFCSRVDFVLRVHWL